MNKKTIDQIIANLNKAKLVTKATPWSMEANSLGEFFIRFVGIRIDDADWHHLLSNRDNILIKFYLNRTHAWAEILLANQPPFILLDKYHLDKKTKWENILGKVKQKIHHDYKEMIDGLSRVDNIYLKIVNSLKTKK